jgi:hypothetical protein
MLDIENEAEYSDVVTGMEFHSHKPYASATYNTCDEIRIPIGQQDIITAPFESTLHITGKLSGKTAAATDADVSLVNNAVAYLFDDIRYEIGGIEVDRTKNVGITTTMKNLLSVQVGEQDSLKNACWLGPDKTMPTTDFQFSVPLRLLLGFAEDYRKIIVNVKQELILLRASSDKNAVISANAAECTLTISSIYWRVPHITVSDTLRLKLLRKVESDSPVHLPFRSWELHEYPVLPQTTQQSWTIKTSSQLEKPRFVILAFQTDRKNDLKKNMALFDHCELMNVKLYLDSQYFPYDNIHGDKSIFYEMFSRFQNSYYGHSNTNSVVTLDTFKTKTPLYVIDCSRQNDSIKSGSVDVRLEFEAKNNFPDKTTAYCLLLHDSHLVYTMLTGSVKKMM